MKQRQPQFDRLTIRTPLWIESAIALERRRRMKEQIFTLGILATAILCVIVAIAAITYAGMTLLFT